jgi:NADPH:quinone reductase-like Zn-dependent oxidoreductase
MPFDYMAWTSVLFTVTRTFPFEDVQNAHKAMESGHTWGKIVLEM